MSVFHLTLTVTLAFKLDIDMVKMHLNTENEVPSNSGSKIIALTDT